MKTDVVLLDAETFTFLALSSEVYGGIGRGSFSDGRGDPHCVIGHAKAETVGYAEIAARLRDAGLTVSRNDTRLMHRGGIYGEQKVNFERYCEIVKVDIAS